MGASPWDGKGDAMTASASISRLSRGRWRTRVLLAGMAGAGLATALVAGATSAGAAVAAAPAGGTAPGGTYVGNSLVMAYTGTDHTVVVKDLANGRAFNVGGNLIAAPALAPSGSNVLIFGPGTNHQLYYKQCTLAGSCTGWVSLGGSVTSKAGAVFQGPNVADYSVYARGGDGAVWGRTHTTAGWGAWHSLGGKLLAGTGPAAADLNGTFILVVGTNKHLSLSEVGVTGFVGVGGTTTASPGLAVIAAPAALVGVARGTNNVGYYHRFLNTSPGWHSLGGKFTSGLTVAGLAGTSTTSTLGLGTDSNVYASTQGWTTYPPSQSGWIKET